MFFTKKKDLEKNSKNQTTKERGGGGGGGGGVGGGGKIKVLMTGIKNHPSLGQIASERQRG